MLGEKNIIPELESQYINFLNFIDKLGLSFSTRMDLYRRFQNELYDRSIKYSIEQGRKLEGKRENTTRSSKSTEYINNIRFSEDEELIINQYVSYFSEYGIDAPINFLVKPSERDAKLIEEAISRLKKQEQEKTI